MYELKFQSMQGFYNDFGNYLEANGMPLNGDRTYVNHRSTLEGIINLILKGIILVVPFSSSTINPLFETKYEEVFIQVFIAVFDDKTNGELKENPDLSKKEKEWISKKRTKNKLEKRHL